METKEAPPAEDPSTSETTPPPKKTLPKECILRLQRFDEALTALELALDPIIRVGFDEHLKRKPLELVQVDVMTMFVLNSIGWCLAAQRGKDPKEIVQLADELRRTKQYVDRLKSIEMRKSAPGLNKRVAKAFVRNALWEVPGKRARLDDDSAQNVDVSDEEKDSDSEEISDLEPAAADADEGPSYVVKNVKFEGEQEPHQLAQVRTGKNT
ncbi:hypothetical protein RB195_019973 [Necator americanus]|uniref:Nuclear nucleic acid-binding protein C1D n=1 Tax=Necator americanus TaxID=51031 RepID=A0ABR1CIS6_NECAM